MSSLWPHGQDAQRCTQALSVRWHQSESNGGAKPEGVPFGGLARDGALSLGIEGAAFPKAVAGLPMARLPSKMG
ncbi:hypothetical protein BZL41_05990 [Pseudomonas sp. PIC25]|nr:hypothetical protein BZL41_05990 [Pseudomonas sp. PIC25]